MFENQFCNWLGDSVCNDITNQDINDKLTNIFFTSCIALEGKVFIQNVTNDTSLKFGGS